MNIALGKDGVWTGQIRKSMDSLVLKMSRRNCLSQIKFAKCGLLKLNMSLGQGHNAFSFYKVRNLRS